MVEHNFKLPAWKIAKLLTVFLNDPFGDLSFPIMAQRKRGPHMDGAPSISGGVACFWRNIIGDCKRCLSPFLRR